VERTIVETKDCPPESIEEVLALDAEARSLAQRCMSSRQVTL
jgi:hypothetical protein